jgi:hypothetical protein
MTLKLKDVIASRFEKFDGRDEFTCMKVRKIRENIIWRYEPSTCLSSAT